MSENAWKGRDLTNYKAMHEDTAKRNGCYDEFTRASTLTQARKILFGEKKKQYTETKIRGSNKWRK